MQIRLRPDLPIFGRRKNSALNCSILCGNLKFDSVLTGSRDGGRMKIVAENTGAITISTLRGGYTFVSISSLLITVDLFICIAAELGIRLQKVLPR